MKYSICTLLLIVTATLASAQRRYQAHENRDMTRPLIVSYNSAETQSIAEPARSTYFQSLDGAWQYRILPSEKSITEALASSDGWNSVDVPQKSAIDGNVVIYKRNYKRPFSWVDRQIFLRIESISAPYEILINGQKRGANTSTRVGSEFDITKYSNEGNNTLAVVVFTDHVATKLNSQASRGASISKSVAILAQPRVRIRDYVVEATPSGTSGLLNLGIIVKSHLLNPKEVEVFCDIFNPRGEKVFTGRRDARFEMKLEDTVRFFDNIQNVEPWSFETPNLYRINVKIQNEGRYGEYITFNIGFRDVVLDGKTFILNGYKVPLAIKNFTPTFNAEKDYKELESIKMQGYNAIRVGATLPEGFFSLCDRIGIYLCPTADISTPTDRVPMNPTNDPSYESMACDRVMSLYNATKSHPSVIMFSVANDNTPNGYNLKEAYLSLRRNEAHRPIYFDGARTSWNNDLDMRLYSQPTTPGKLIEYGAIGLDGGVTITNSSIMTPIRGAQFILWSDKAHKKMLLSGTLDVNLAPGNSTKVQIPLGKLKLKPANVVEVKAQ